MLGDWMSIESGVPQGSVLGPVFFFIYINDLIKSITIPIKVHADDTKLILVYNDSSECIDLQNTLEIIHMWTNKFLLYLNIEKCKVLHIGSKKYQNNKTSYYLDGSRIQSSEGEKDLGVLVNSNLCWTQHITKICLNATYWLKLLHKCFQYKPIEVIKKLYTSIIRPKLEYAAVIWNPITAKCISMLEKVQRRCLKVGSLAKLDYPTRLSILGTWKIRRTRGDLIHLFRYYKRYDNITLPNAPALSGGSTRGHRFKFIQERCHHYSRKNFLFNRVANIWNRLPSSIINVESVNQFKNSIDKIDLSSF